MRIMRKIAVSILLFVSLQFAESLNAMVTANILQRVFFIRVGSAQGTAFTIEVDGRQYLVTARHVLPASGTVTSIELFANGSWVTVSVQTIEVLPREADIAVLAAPQQLSPILPIGLGVKDSYVSQEVFFLGYPYGLFADGKQVNNGLPLPFVKRAIISAFDGGGQSQRIFLDGINNPGFSGGPVVRVSPDRTPTVIGVVSGYRFVQEPVQQGGVATALTVPLNTGLAIAYPLERALEAISRRPIGFPLPKPGAP